MRLNQYIAASTGLSRRAADLAISDGRVRHNNQLAHLGSQVQPNDQVMLDGKLLKAPDGSQTIMLNKPYGYVCSRDGQGSETVYDLLPPELHHLKTVGRLDRDSTGLLLMTNNGRLTQDLTHPSKGKDKIYQVQISPDLNATDQAEIENGILLEDGRSALQLKGRGQLWQVTMQQGRNRQIRRTFAARGYKVVKLHRSQFGDYKLGGLQNGKFRDLSK